MLHGGIEHTWNQTTPDIGDAPSGYIDGAADAVGGDGQGWFPTMSAESYLDTGAGSTDEWVGRATSNIGNQPVEGFADWVAGSTDETVGNTTSGNRPVEGFADWIAGGTDEAVGQTASGIANFGSTFMLLGFGGLALLAVLIVVMVV